MSEPAAPASQTLDLTFRVAVSREISTEESVEMAARLQDVLTGLTVVRQPAGDPGTRATLSDVEMTSWAIVPPSPPDPGPTP